MSGGNTVRRMVVALEAQFNPSHHLLSLLPLPPCLIQLTYSADVKYP